MALSQPTLASELEAAFAAVIGGAAGPLRLAQAFGAYFKGATLGGVGVVAAAVDALAVPAMSGGMAFTAGSTAAAGAAQLAGGLTAFWGAVSGAPASFWPLAAVVTPPAGLAGVASALVAAFATNAQPGVTRAQAAAAIAAALHPAAGQGGTGTLPGPAVTPIL